MQLLLSLLFYWLIFIPLPSAELNNENETGHRIAIHIHSDGSFMPTLEQLRFANSIGVDLIEISEPERIQSEVLQDFYILLSSENKFVTHQQLSTNKSEFILTTEQRYRSLPPVIRERIAAISMFKFPSDNSERFLRELAVAADTLSQLLNKPLYYQSALNQPLFYPQSLSFIAAHFSAKEHISVSASPVLFFDPVQPSHRKSVYQFQNVLHQSLEHESSIVILPAEWFFYTLENQPDIARLLPAYFAGEQVQLPLPAETDPSMEANWHVILLFIILGAFIIHIKYHPFFIPLAARYFFNHSFFITDLFEGRIRSRSSGLTILGLHALAAGLVFLVVSDFMFSSNGFEALSFHYPYLFITGYEQYTLFTAGFIISLISHLLSIFWIFILNKNILYLNQAMHLYCWPLLLNILIAGILVSVIEVGSGDIMIYSLFAIFLLIWFFSYNIGAIDSSRQLDGNPFWNLTFTVGLHSILLLTAILFFLFSPEFIEPLELAVSLP